MRFMLVSASLKGIVHLSSFTHPQVVPNLSGFLPLSTTEDILRIVVCKELMVARNFHSMGKTTLSHACMAELNDEETILTWNELGTKSQNNAHHMDYFYCHFMCFSELDIYNHHLVSHK